MIVNNIKLKSDGVNIRDLQPQFYAVVVELARLHTELFDRPLLVVSGKDGQHVPTSRHYKGLAVDVRSWDKTDSENVLWAAVMAERAKALDIAVFDERYRKGRPHWHIEAANYP